MRVERRISTKLRDIETGECFKNVDGRIFMKTGDSNLVGRWATERQTLCVNLENGMVFWFDDDYSAVPIKIKAVEE